MAGVVGGSSIDVNSLVSQLVAAERKPLDDQVARATTKVTTQISATSALLGALSTFQTSLNGLKTTSAFSGRTASSTDPEIATGNATTTAAPGRYDIEVQRLASAHQLSSNAFAQGSTQVVGTGTLNISLGSTSFSVNINAPANTLADIRNAINAATDNPGVTATLITATDGAHLVLTSTKTGAAMPIQVTQSGGDGNLASLTYAVGNTANYRELRPAQDALVNIAGYPTTSATNVIEGVIEGVSFNLVKAEPGTTVSVDVSYDKAGAKTKINAFVAAYNTLRGVINKLGGYDAASKTGGAMMGDGLLTGIDAELRRTLSAPLEGATGAIQTLADIGIKTVVDIGGGSSPKGGTLQVDDAKLDAALASNFDAVARLFGAAETGVAAKLYTQVGARIADGSGIDLRNDSLQAQQRALQKKSADINTRMQIVQAGYLKQFTALDTLLSKLQSTSAFLTQQISSLGSLNK